MYYISIAEDDPNKLTYYCRHCGNTDTSLLVKNTIVSTVHLKKSQQEFSHVINKYTKLDPTLPRVSNVKCPNTECNPADKEIVCIRYDETNYKYVYLCCTCDTVWKTEDQT